MKTTKKLSLNDLKVESFVTSLEGKDSQTVKGGSTEFCFGLGISFCAGTIAATVVTLIIVDGVADAVQEGVVDAIGGKTEDTTKKNGKK